MKRLKPGDFVWAQILILDDRPSRFERVLVKITGDGESLDSYKCLPQTGPAYGAVDEKEITRYATNEEIAIWLLEN